MPKRPRPPALKLLQGERPDRMPKHPPDPDTPVEVPLPPDWMSPQAVEVWNRLAPQLHRKGLLSDWDLEMFGVGCEHYAKWKRANALVNQSDVLVRGDKGVVVKSPALQVMRDTSLVVKQWAQEFGLTPSARSGIDLGENDGDGDLQKLLS